jgi:hypothetical protein
MARQKPTSIPPDLLEAIVEETQRRLLEQRVLIPADLTNSHANAAYAYTAEPAQNAHPPARRNTIATRIAFLVIMALVLTLSIGFSIAMGLSLAGLFMAFTILPISAPFFLIGGVVAISLFFLFRFIGRLSSRASEKADYIRAQKKLRSVVRT